MNNTQTNTPTHIVWKYKNTFFVTLRPDAQHGVRAKVVLLANDPLPTLHIQQRQRMTELTKKGLPPIATIGMMEEYKEVCEKTTDYMLIMMKRCSKRGSYKATFPQGQVHISFLDIKLLKLILQQSKLLLLHLHSRGHANYLKGQSYKVYSVLQVY